jgi:predicted AAA+ superfamily ATPase
MRDQVQRDQALSSLLDTVIERDFYFVRNSKIRPHVLRELLQTLVTLQGQPVSISQLARRFRMSAPSMKVVLQTFENLFLIRNHGKTVFFEDLGIAELLRAEFGGRTPINSVEEVLYSELKAIRAYSADERVKLSAYHSRGGSSVPMILQTKSTGIVAIAVDEGEELTQKSLKGLYSFKKTQPQATLLHVHQGRHATIHKDRVLSVPVGWML